MLHDLGAVGEAQHEGIVVVDLAINKFREHHGLAATGRQLPEQTTDAVAKGILNAV